MENCIFCKIVKGEIPCVKIWEDKDFLAILDVFPNTKGMTLVLTKKHFDSYAFEFLFPFFFQILGECFDAFEKLNRERKDHGL